MQARRYSPAPPLSQFVSCLWYWQGAPQTHSKERLLPTGESSIIFNLRDRPIRIYDAYDLNRYTDCGLSVLSGPRSGCFVIDTEQEERVIGVQFHAGGAFPFFRTPVSEMRESSIDLLDLWKDADTIRERVLAAPDVDSMLRTLETCLLEQLVRPPELHPAVGFALQHFREPGHATRVHAVTERIGLSPRRFIELFERQVGLTPKVFCRVRRFQNVLQTVHGRQEVDWTRVALDCDYYDQSHFIHDFRSFSGLTPSAYLEHATQHLNHVPLRQV
jgi:AraC-like DNA-binding protein